MTGTARPRLKKAEHKQLGVIMHNEVGKNKIQDDMVVTNTSHVKWDMNSGGVKFDQQKVRFDLIPSKPLNYLGEVYTMGAVKYAPRQWEQGMDWGRLYSAALRHMNAFWAGQDLDEESALPHLAHAAWNLFALLEYMETHPELDTRPHTLKHGISQA
jgi:hypothetical protein